MALPPGDWELHIFHGLEYLPLHETFHIESGAWTRRTLKLQRHTDIAAQGWHSGDDHTHARLMSSEDGEKLVTIARAADIRVCNVLEMGDWMRSYYPQRGSGRDYFYGCLNLGFRMTATSGEDMPYPGWALAAAAPQR